MVKKRAVQALAMAVTVLALMGCQSGNQGNTDETASTNAASGSTSQRPALSHRSRSQARNEASPQPSPEPATETVTLPAGTEIPVRLVTALNTGSVTPGSTFEGTLAAPLTVNGVEVAATGSSVTGSVTNVVSSGRLKRPAELALVLTSITPTGGAERQISTSTWSMKGKSHKKRDLVMIGGGAGLGAAIGAIAGGGKGAAIGSAVGGGAGTAGAFATGKDEIKLPAETRLNFKLSAPVSFTFNRAG